MITNLRQSPILNLLTAGQIADPLQEVMTMEIPEDILGGEEEATHFIEMVETMLDEMKPDEPLPEWLDPNKPILTSDGIPLQVIWQDSFGMMGRPMTLEEYCKKWVNKVYYVDIPNTMDYYKFKIK